MNNDPHDRPFAANGTGTHRRRGSPVRVVIVDDHLLVADSIAAALDAQDDLTVVEVAPKSNRPVARSTPPNR